MKNRQNFFNRLKWQHIDHFFNTNAGLMRVDRPLGFTAVVIDFFIGNALLALPPVLWRSARHEKTVLTAVIA
ncbi:TPA: hypothetical protein N2F43_004085 [Salmonella enterica]|nr:hypothetical protein [Salmonella enterica]